MSENKYQFQDVCHLFAGCKVKTDEGIGTFVKWCKDGLITVSFKRKSIPFGEVDVSFEPKEVKPILKCLIRGWGKEAYYKSDIELLIQGYDVFNWIENGIAINANTLNPDEL